MLKTFANTFDLEAAVKRCGKFSLVGTVGDIEVHADNYGTAIKVDGKIVLTVMRKEGGLKELVDLLNKTILD